MQRVKDAERFLMELDRPVPGISGGGATVTEQDLEQDAASFVAFATAFGVAPPRPISGSAEPIDVPSEPA